tara:strand:+ start:1402 stop:2571 length:1170 start_codon:yes stop_codon:yes gene_type:complete
MKIYSIKEIVKATNNILNQESEFLYKNNKKTKKIVLPPETEKIILAAEESIQLQKNDYLNKEEPLILTNETPNQNSSKINSHNYNIKIKPEVKDHMINELYLYLKKKIRKNTLQLIIDEQLEIKNLRNKINILKQTENELKDNYLKLKNKYESTLKNNEDLKINKVQLDSEIKELKIDNRVLQDNLDQVKDNKEQLDVKIKELKINNRILQNDLNQVNESREHLNNESKEFKSDLSKTKINLKELIEKNRTYEINNNELKNTVSRYIVNTKTIQEKLNIAEELKKSKLSEQTEKVKFYQEENVRLSSELLATQKKNTTIKENLDSIEMEKEKISNKIKDLTKSIDEKTNIIPSNFINENSVKTEEKNETLNDKEQKSLDEVINRIFAKI